MVLAKRSHWWFLAKRSHWCFGKRVIFGKKCISDIVPLPMTGVNTLLSFL